MKTYWPHFLVTEKAAWRRPAGINYVFPMSAERQEWVAGDQISPDDYLYFFSWLFSELEKVNCITLSASDLRCWISNELDVSRRENCSSRTVMQDQGRKEEAWFLPSAFNSTMIIRENLILNTDVSLMPIGKYSWSILPNMQPAELHMKANDLKHISNFLNSMRLFRILKISTLMTY